MTETQVARLYRSISIALGIVCIVSTVGLAETIVFYGSYLSDKDSRIQAPTNRINQLEVYTSRLESWLAGNITQLQSQRDSLNVAYQDYVSKHVHTNSEYDSSQSNYDSLTNYVK